MRDRNAPTAAIIAGVIIAMLLVFAASLYFAKDNDSLKGSVPAAIDKTKEIGKDISKAASDAVTRDD